MWKSHLVLDLGDRDPRFLERCKGPDPSDACSVSHVSLAPNGIGSNTAEGYTRMLDIALEHHASSAR